MAAGPQIPTLNGRSVASLVPTATESALNGGSPLTAVQAPDSIELDETTLFKALIARGKHDPSKLTFDSRDEENALANQVLRDFDDYNAGCSQYVRNVTELWANWRGTTEPKNFPFDGCNNVRLPLTSVHVETMLSRIAKAIFGGEFVAKMSYLDKQVPNDQLNEANQWFKWELTEVVKIYKWAVNMLRNVLITGIDVNIPSYCNETRFLHSRREFDISDQSQPQPQPENPPSGGQQVSASQSPIAQAQQSPQPQSQPEPQARTLSELIEQSLQKIIHEPNDWGVDEAYGVTKQTKPGEYKTTDGGYITFSLPDDASSLRADIFRKETIFNGVRINQIQLEDLVCPPTGQSIDELPFFGVRCWYTIDQYRQALEDEFFLDLGDEENKRIMMMADVKIGQSLDHPITDLQDREESTDSTGSSLTNDASRQFIEIYRWEGWWIWGTDSNAPMIDRVLQPATQVCVWVAVQARRVVKIERLEDLNKDGKRSGVKFGFIEEPNRFFPISLAGWDRHLQTVGDAIWNQRLDSGLLYNVPWGFYKPTAGLTKGAEPISIEMGKFFPCADPQGINMPRSNWQPAFSFAEEGLLRQYAGEQSGLSGGATGAPISKRQSASEYVGIASAIDLRTELFVNDLLASLRELLYRILGLYQQFGPRQRIFRVGGDAGVTLVKQFERSRLQGKLFLEMAGSLAQINEQNQRQIALDMMQILMEPLWTQIGVVGPDTYYQAIKKLAELQHYDGVELHKPKLPPMSDLPDVEEHQMFAGQKPVGPTLGENTDEHMQHHAMTAADSKLMQSWPPESQQLLAQHMQETMKTKMAQQIVAQQQAALAGQMAQTMAAKGIRPGQSGQQTPNENLGPGAQDEGVQGAGAGNSGAQPMPLAA